jgi:HEAT repeat protein
MIEISVFGAILAVAGMMSGATEAIADGQQPSTTPVYGAKPADQVEFLSSPDRIASVASGKMGASAIWETLEHGEAVECLDCIPAVESLLYDQNKETREIAAWWLRKRIFGVFGPGEAYERTVNTLAGNPDANKRADAAYALGEFLTLSGVAPLSNAIKGDQSPAVRAAAASALGRLNDDGAGALSVALGDADSGVRLAALKSAGRVTSFSDAGAVAKLTGDPNTAVRQGGVELLGSMHAKDSVGALINLAQNDPDADVRSAACHSLGMLHDATATQTLQNLSTNDSNQFVRDQARIALRRL